MATVVKSVVFLFTLDRLMTTGLNAVAAGVSQQTQGQPVWNFSLHRLARATKRILLRDRPDGVLAVGLGSPDHAQLLEALVRSGIPTVHAGEFPTPPACPEVRSPNRLLGKMGARHLLERGLRSFAFVGSFYPANQRYEGFMSELADAGIDGAPSFHASASDDEWAGLGPFLKKLPKPVGILAGNDEAGWTVAHHALLEGIAIPEQLALISIGNNDPWCSLATPPLSSIEPPGMEMGRQALKLLDDLIEGRPTPRFVDVPAHRIAERRSTAIVHAASPDISAAIGFIHQRRGIGMNVRDVAEFAGISVSTLGRGMKQALGRSPLAEIHRLRLQAATELLAGSDTPMKTIAARCGFRDSKHLSMAIRAATGHSPREYRAQQRSHFS